MKTDLRSWLTDVEAHGEIKTVDGADWNKEIGTVVELNAKARGPALLFDKIKDYPAGFRLLAGAMSSAKRLSLTLGMPLGVEGLDLIRSMKDKMRGWSDELDEFPPMPVKDGAIFQNVDEGERVNLLKFPAPLWHHDDGGRYIGTADAIITRDPDAGWLNVGCYRQMVHDRNHVGLYLSPGKDARLHIERYWSRNEPCEIVAVWGVDPAMFIAASLTFAKTISELEFVGGMTGRPVELVKGQVGSIPYPARAEIVIEGIVHPNAIKLEGPFGEFTGYYGRPEDYAFNVEVKAIHHRDDPILTHALMADYPANEDALLYSIARSAKIWNDLDRVGVPGIKGVYSHPAAAGGWGMTVVSLEQRYAGHAQQALALAAQVPGGAYYAKWIIAVDDDVDPSNINQVLWAMSTRCNPVEDIDILRQTWSTWLDPTQNPPEKRPYGSKALINACMEHRYIKQFSRRTKLRRSVYESVAARWSELGFPGAPPKLWSLEE